VPNYELPPSLEKIEILRVVVRENVTEQVSPPLPTPFPFLSLNFIILVNRQAYGRRRECRSGLWSRSATECVID